VSLLVQFREIEPEAAFLHAAIANYFLDLGNLNSTMEMLKEAPDLERAMKDSFYVAVLFDALVDLGEFPKARICFEQYPQPHAGYLFWRTEGMFQDHVERDNAAAVRAYRQALTTPPAKFDWGLMSRLSVCLRKSGEVDESQSIQAQVDHLTTDVLTAERTSHLRQIISRLDDPEVARELREFYAEFGLQREVAAWQEQENRLRSGKKTLQTPFTFE
jgi:tetratricopeptide (TPR) repeat protein